MCKTTENMFYSMEYMWGKQAKQPAHLKKGRGTVVVMAIQTRSLRKNLLSQLLKH